jgi:protein TonB
MRFIMPTSIPKTVARVIDEPPKVIGDPGPSAGIAVPFGLPGGISGALPEVLTPPLPVKPPVIPPKPEAVTPKRIRTSSIELARILHRVDPVYPAVAKLAHVSGTVELTGVIATDGHIRELKALSGNPLLIKAALDAVSQWIYAPPVLNGERVEVIAPITVNFRLDR